MTTDQIYEIPMKNAIRATHLTKSLDRSTRKGYPTKILFEDGVDRAMLSKQCSPQ